MQINLLEGLRPKFDGSTFDAALDADRLTSQLARVRQYMQSVGWVTLHEIAQATGYPEGSISARLRDLRKARFGSHEVLRRRRSPGTFEYRVNRGA